MNPSSQPLSELLSDYDRKRERARHHFEDLRASIEKFRGHRQEPIRGTFDPSASEYHFDVALRGISADWPLLLGDFVYDARSSLDYLITALIRSAGNQENNGSQFPIYGIDHISWQEIDDYWEKDPQKRIARNLKGTPERTKAALKRLQPFFEVPRTDPSRHPLFSLQVMSNRDKHRRLNLLAHRAELDFVDESGRRFFDGTQTHSMVISDKGGAGYDLTLAVQQDLGPDVWLHHSYDVHLGEPPELVGDLIKTLSGINRFIDERVYPTVISLM